MTRLLLAIAALALSMVSAPSRAETVTVVVDKLAFAPTEIEVKVGDTIEWVNNDIFDHTATVRGGWDVEIPAGARAWLKIERAEAVEFYCRYHPNMTGRIVSKEP